MNIRNFCIISHIDHGKSTLADRLLELTGTVGKREMKDQILDNMDLERERGITIKLQPVRMIWHWPKNPKSEARSTKQTPNSNDKNSKPVSDWPHQPLLRKPTEFSASNLSNSEYILNLIDTPGHVDFSYEVSRSLAAVEGAVLLVDATQGVQAQTLANLELARRHNLVIIPAVNKIDLPEARPEEAALEIAEILNISPDEVVFISAKTGENVDKLVEKIIEKIPPPLSSREPYARALIFDSFYDDFRGVVAYVRVFDGEIKKGEKIIMHQNNRETTASELGFIQLGLKPQEKISAGEIGYIVTTLKEVGEARVGDTITTKNDGERIMNNGKTHNSSFIIHNSAFVPLPGYQQPKPMVFAEIYTTTGEDFGQLRDALQKLKLSDSSIFFEPSSSNAFGFGFRCGFLGILHLEIVKERLEREYDLQLIVTTPEVQFEKSAAGYLEPWAKVEIIAPGGYLGKVLELLQARRGRQKNIKHLESKTIVEYELPLSEVIVDFYDRVKSATQGYGSVNYELIGMHEGDLVELDFMIAGEKIEAFHRLVYRGFVERTARHMVAKMKEVIPRQNFEVKIQAAVGARILASERIAPFRKDVTEKLYGGDVTRKRKLLEKQKKGKRKMAQIGKVSVPTDVFIKLLKY